MMTEQQKSKLAELKAAIASTATLAGGAAIEVRDAVIDLKRELRRGGVTARELAFALGLHETTLCRWERDRRTAPRGRRRPASSQAASEQEQAFRLVRLSPAHGTPRELAQTSGPAAPETRTLRVAHAPSGLVIDGLDVEALAALLRRMS
jgi:transcriptional regulator with XRE-family HTH domain